MTTLFFDSPEPRRLPNVGTVELPLDNFKESSSFDVLALTNHGGVLASDSTPARDAINAATDGCQRIIWASSDVQELTTQAVLPIDFDATKNLVFHARVVSGDTTDAVGFTINVFFNEGDSIVTDTTTTNQTTTYAEVIATISLDDVPSGAQTISIRIAPVAHGTDTMAMTAAWLEYTPKFPLEASEGLYCCHKTIQQQHTLKKVRIKSQNVTTTGTVTVTLKKRDPGDPRGGATIATVLNNTDLGNVTNVSTTYEFFLKDPYKGAATKDREYFVIVTGTSADDRFEEPCLLIEASDIIA